MPRFLLIIIFFFFMLHVTQAQQKSQVVGYSLSGYLQQFRDLSTLPQYAHNVYDGQVSTYDRTGMNNDGFNGTYSFIRRNADSSLVLFDQKGPGVINRIWTPTPTEDTLDFYIDDTLRPAFSICYIDLYTGKVFPFVAPLCANQLGGYYCYLPIPFQKACKIVLRAKSTRFHQIGYRLYPAGTAVKSFSANLQADEKAALQSLANAWTRQPMKAIDFFPEAKANEITRTVKLQAGSSATIFQSNSPGRILGFELQAPVRLDTIAKSIDLKITWDGDTEPAVYCPLADYFGYAFGEASMQGLVAGSNGKRFYSFFPMPYDRTARIELVYRRSALSDAPQELNFTGKFLVSNQPRDTKKEGKFYARWNRENPVSPGKPFTMLDVKGQGHFAGVNLQAQGLGTGITSFFEGDDSTVVDGELRMHGTGSEDFFNGGWYALLDCWDDGMSLPLSGALDYSIPLCRTGGYRFFLTDKISFSSSFLQTIEHGPEFNAVPADYTSVSYFYCSQNNPQQLRPTAANTKIYVPDTLEVYPQLTLSAMDESLGIEAKWDGTPAKSMYYTVAENSLLKFSLQDIPLGRYSVYIDYRKGPDAAQFSLWQRQTQLTGWINASATDPLQLNMQKMAEIDLTALNHSLSFRFRVADNRKKFVLGRIILVRK